MSFSIYEELPCQVVAGCLNARRTHSWTFGGTAQLDRKKNQCKPLCHKNISLGLELLDGSSSQMCLTFQYYHYKYLHPSVHYRACFIERKHF